MPSSRRRRLSCPLCFRLTHAVIITAAAVCLPMNIVNEQDLNNFETEKTNFQTFQRPEETSHPTLVQDEMDKANEEAEANKESEE